MRIFNGSYELSPGIQFYSPNRLYDYEISDNEVILHALILQGEEKIQGRIMKYSITSPSPDVLRVQIRHHRPGNMIKFITSDKKEKLHVTDGEESLVISSGGLSVEFDKKEWEYSFKTTRILSGSRKKAAGVVFDSDKKHYITEKLSLSVGDVVYGMGEHFSPFIKNGQHIDIWNRDPATESDLAYKNIPFYLTSGGYGVFVNTSSLVDFEVCTEDAHAVRFTVPSHELDYFIFYGPSPGEVIRRYTALTGRPPLIPKWSLGLWLTTSFLTDYNEEVISEQIDEMFRRQIPLTVFHFDCFWMKERHWCNFLWDRDLFPDPVNMLKRLKKRGLKICLWINPYVSELSEIFEEGADRGFFLKNGEGAVYQIDWWQPGVAFVDFTNPEACEWYKSKLRPLLEMGVDTFKTDFGESAPEDAVYYSGADGHQMHNYYTYLYNQTVFNLLEEYFGKGKALVFARSATAGSQKYPVHWSGDSCATFSSMYGQLRGGLSFGVSGGAFWSHDVGGFYEKPRADVYKRWIAFGLLSSHSRLHGNDSFRVPWNFDEESSRVLKKFTEIRHKLIPYLYAACYEASLTGVPVMRPMFMEFPEDPGCRFIDRQYMLGRSLLVAPVFNAEGVVEFYLPYGLWTNYWTQDVVEGGRWLCETHDFFSLPLYIREDTILPTGPVEQAPLQSSLKDLIITLYFIETSTQIVIFEGKEIGIQANKQEKGIQVTLTEKIPGLVIRLSGVKQSWQCSESTMFIKTGK